MISFVDETLSDNRSIREASRIVGKDEKSSGLSINSVMVKIAQEVPSYKFVPLIYQISSRLGVGTEEFRETMRVLLERLALEHPHHILLQLYALANADKVEGKGASQYRKNLDKSKIEAARAIEADQHGW